MKAAAPQAAPLSAEGARIRPHLDPHPDDALYLVLKDLRDYLERFRSDSRLRVLDYGAGYSPYRSLFPQAEYLRADYVAYPGIDYRVDADGRVPTEGAQFDLVLSTQVAEHVVNPDAYFAEAWRLLKPGGRLVVTTHGVWEDHGAPYDFQRWTAAGLARDLATAGFIEIRTTKLTAGRRAHLFLGLQALTEFRGGASRARTFVARALQWTLRRIRPAVHRWVDRRFSQLKVSDSGSTHTDGPPFYLLVAAEAARPRE